MKGMGTKALANWLAMSLLAVAGCDSMMDDSDVEPDEHVSTAVSELTRNGQPDLTFSESGQGRLFAPTQAMWLSVVADAGGGKVAYASGAWNPSLSRYDGIVGRVTSTGTRDTTWSWNEGNPGGDRWLNDDLVADDTSPQAMQIMGGMAFVAGWHKVGAGQRPFLVKLDSRGQLVTAFNGDGIVRPVPLGYDNYAISRIFVDAGRVITIGGASKMVDGTRHYYAAVARFNATTGVWDENYGNHGWAIRETGAGPGVVGTIRPGRPEVIIAANNKVFRFDDKGVYDDDIFKTRKYTSVIDMTASSDGHVYLLSNVGGTEEPNHPQWSGSAHRLIALKADGTKDEAFAFIDTPDHGNGGGPAGPADPDWFDEPGRADLTSEGTFAAQRVEYNERLGRIYVLGNVTHKEGDETKRYWGTLAFLTNGNYDLSYGESGRVYTDFRKLDAEVAHDMALQTFTNANGLQEGIVMSGQGTLDHKGPLARVLIDWGRAGEPCRANACDPGYECKNEGAAGKIKVKTCRKAN